MFTDTNSLVYKIRTDDVHKDFYEDKNSFDFSNYPGYSVFFFFYLVNKQVIGKTKDEFKGEIIREFGGLKSDGQENKKAKGVKKNVLQSTRHKQFVDDLCYKKLIRHSTKRIQSISHKTGAYVCKIYLSFFDGKISIYDNDINSLDYFDKDIRSQ